MASPPGGHFKNRENSTLQKAPHTSGGTLHPLPLLVQRLRHRPPAEVTFTPAAPSRE